MNLLNPYRFAAAGSNPSFVAKGSCNGTNWAVPSGTQDGDLMVAWAGADSNTLTTPSGWTLRVGPTVYSSQNYYAACYTRVASSEPANYVFATGSYRYGFILSYRNASSVDVAGSIQSITGTTPTLTGITSASGSMLLALMHSRDNGVTFTPPSGMTERADETSGSYWQTTGAELLNADSSNRQFTVATNSYGVGGLLIAIT